MSSYGEFEYNGIHIDITKNKESSDISATLYHELTHQTLAAYSYVGALDLLLSTIGNIENNPKKNNIIRRLYKRISESIVRVEESTAMFCELGFMKVFNQPKYYEILAYYKNDSDYYKLYKFKTLEPLLYRITSESDFMKFQELMISLACMSMNINLKQLDPLDGKELVCVDKMPDLYNPNHRLSRILNYMSKNSIELSSFDPKDLGDLFEKLDLPYLDFDWDKFKTWATNKIIEPLELLPIDQYINLETNCSFEDRLLSSSAYNSNISNIRSIECTDSEQIRNVFSSCQIWFLENDPLGEGVHNVLIDYISRKKYDFYSKEIFTILFEQIPLVLTDRNNFCKLKEKFSQLESTNILVDLGEASKYSKKYIDDNSLHEYYIHMINEYFFIIFMKGPHSPLFFYLCTYYNLNIFISSHLKNGTFRDTWWETTPQKYIDTLSEYLTHE